MDKKLQEQIRIVAEYDGWEYKGQHAVYGAIFRKDQTKIDIGLLDYHTNIASLWPVAKRVKEELYEQKSIAYDDFISTVATMDIPALFTAVTEAIDLLTKLKRQ